MSILDNLEKLRKKYDSPEDIKQINDWVKLAKINRELLKLKSNFAIEELLVEFKRSVTDINNRLSYDVAMLNEEGRVMFEKKAVYERMISMFENAKAINKSIEEEIKEKL